MAGVVQAGQVSGPVSGEVVTPGAQSGSIGGSLGAPLPVQMSVPSLSGAIAPNMASVLAPAPASAPALARPAAVQAQAVTAAVVPALPQSAVTPVAGRALNGTLKAAAAPTGPAFEPGNDPGRVMFDRGLGKRLDPDLLDADIYSPEIMSRARKSGLVYELDAANIKRMKPGVNFNYVIARNPDGKIVMTVGRLDPGNEIQSGVKHVALGGWREVAFAGEMRVSPETGRPTLDFNSGMYSRVGLDPRWKPTPENARALAASAESILGTRVDILDHFENRLISFRAEPAGPLRSVVRRGASRGEGWEVDGRPARSLSGGAFKDVLIHPSNSNLVIKLFSQAGAKNAAGSLAEKRREMSNLGPLLKIGRAPRVVENGALALRTPAGEKTAAYLVQERVIGRELGDMLRDPDHAVGARALKEARALFSELVAARIKLEDGVKMHENISVGRAGGAGAVKAWVLDAGEVTVVPARGVADKVLGRADPLRAYYDSVLAGLSRLSRR